MITIVDHTQIINFILYYSVALLSEPSNLSVCLSHPMMACYRNPLLDFGDGVGLGVGLVVGLVVGAGVGLVVGSGVGL
jgi:hypothetical protein